MDHRFVFAMANRPEAGGAEQQSERFRRKSDAVGKVAVERRAEKGRRRVGDVDQPATAGPQGRSHGVRQIQQVVAAEMLQHVKSDDEIA